MTLYEMHMMIKAKSDFSNQGEFAGRINAIKSSLISELGKMLYESGIMSSASLEDRAERLPADFWLGLGNPGQSGKGFVASFSFQYHPEGQDAQSDNKEPSAEEIDAQARKVHPKLGGIALELTRCLNIEDELEILLIVPFQKHS